MGANFGTAAVDYLSSMSFAHKVERLKAELEQSRRAGKRQAAPFSKGEPKTHPERPGRKAGHPPGHRPAPPPGQVDRTIEGPAAARVPGVPLPVGRRPVAVHDQYQIDLPEPKPVITCFRFWSESGTCTRLGRLLPIPASRVRSHRVVRGRSRLQLHADHAKPQRVLGALGWAEPGAR